MTTAHPPAPWLPPTPRELPEWRSRLREYMTDPEWRAQLAMATDGGSTSLFPTVPGMTKEPGVVAAPLLTAAEEHRLGEAALYYVSEDMTSLALAAASTPPTETIRASRLPSPYGFMMFAEPIGGYTQKLDEALAHTPIAADVTRGLTVTTPIVAASWGTWTPSDVTLEGRPVQWVHHRANAVRAVPTDFEGVWFTFYAPTGSAFDLLPADTVLGRTADGRVMTAGDAQTSPRSHQLNWDNEMVLGYGATFGEPEPDTTKEWAQVIYTAWQLMSQGGKSRFTDVEELPRERAGRKRDRRAGINGPSEVRVVNVHSAHRPAPTAAAQDAEASTGRRAPQWSCRWPVRPYRRNTCLNPRAHADGGCEHEDTLVPGHIKGPGDKPLRLGETVNLWDHQPHDAN